MIYTGQNVKLNDFRLGLKNISITESIMVKREKKNSITAWHGMQFTCGSEDRYAIRRVSIIQPF